MEFVDLVDDKNLLRRLDFLRRLGNTAAHSTKKISRGQARLSLENLFYFLISSPIATTRTTNQPHESDPAMLLELEDAVIVDRTDLAATAAEPVMFYKAAEQVSQFTQRRQEQRPACVPKSLDLTKYGTRKLYIDTMLQDADWTEGADWLNEYPVEGMPNASGTSAVN